MLSLLTLSACTCSFVAVVCAGTQLMSVYEANQRKKKKRKKKLNRDTATYGEKPRFDFCVNQVENQTGVDFIRIGTESDLRSPIMIDVIIFFFSRRRREKCREVFNDIVRALINREFDVWLNWRHLLLTHYFALTPDAK